MLSRAIFYPSLFYNVVMERVSSRNWFDRIDETVILGALPFRSITQKLLDENVRGIVTLTEPFETRFWVNSAEEWQTHGISQLVLSTKDLVEAPKQGDIHRGVDFICLHRRQGTSVYVHCKAGRTRSTTVVACYLMKTRNWSPEESVEYIRSKRPHINLHMKQWRALKSYHDSLREPTRQSRQSR